MQKIFSCKIFKYIWGNTAQENYLCNVNPECTNIVLQEINLRNVILNLPGPTLYEAITCAMLADSSQSSQCCLNTSHTTFCGTNYLCNVNQEHTVIFSQEDKLYCNVVLICLSQYCMRIYLCNVDPQSTNNTA